MTAPVHPLLDRIGREVELRRALESGELVMHYQPLLRMADGVWDRVETLVRWQHPTRGLLGPAEFIPMAEQSGLMVALGERVLDMVLSPGPRVVAPVSRSPAVAEHLGDANSAPPISATDCSPSSVRPGCRRTRCCWR